MKKLITQEFIDRARAVHGDKYVYSFVEYKNNCEKVHIICQEHGMFEQRPNYHLSGKGCPKCGIESKKHTNESFIEKAAKILNANGGKKPENFNELSTDMQNSTKEEAAKRLAELYLQEQELRKQQ